MSYTPGQYREQQRVMAIIAEANATGTCPICRQPQGTWKTGERRMTCGRDACYHRWLGIKPHAVQEEHHEDQAG